jgi:hypothetical protein
VGSLFPAFLSVIFAGYINLPPKLLDPDGPKTFLRWGM